MEEKIYKITLGDGSEISNLKLNGNNFISTEKIEEAFKSAIALSDILCVMRFYFQKLGNISFMITAHLSRDAEFHNRENDLKSISTNTTNYTEMTVIFYSVTFQSSMTILSMRLPNENC